MRPRRAGHGAVVQRRAGHARAPGEPGLPARRARAACRSRCWPPPRRYGRVSYQLAPRYARPAARSRGRQSGGRAAGRGPDVHAMALRRVNGFDYPSGTLYLRSGTRARARMPVHGVRARLDEKRLLGDGRDAAGPDPGDRHRRTLDGGACWRWRDRAAPEAASEGAMPPRSSAGPTTCRLRSAWPTSTMSRGAHCRRRQACCGPRSSGTRNR